MKPFVQRTNNRGPQWFGRLMQGPPAQPADINFIAQRMNSRHPQLPGKSQDTPAQRTEYIFSVLTCRKAAPPTGKIAPPGIAALLPPCRWLNVALVPSAVQGQGQMHAGVRHPGANWPTRWIVGPPFMKPTVLPFLSGHHHPGQALAEAAGLTSSPQC